LSEPACAICKRMLTYCMPTPRLPSDQRRPQLAAAALRLIAARGVSALSTRSLARELGLSSGAIFRHFASVDEVLEAVVERISDALAETYPANTLPPLDRLQAFVAARSRAVGRHSGIFQLLVSEQFRLSLPRHAARRMTGLVSQSMIFLERCIAEGQRDGSIRGDIPAEHLAMLVRGMTQVLALSPRSDSPASSASPTKSLRKLLAAPKGGKP